MALFDHSELTHALLQKLKQENNFELVILVERESFNAESPHAPQQKRRLRSLQRAEAKIVLSREAGRYGSMHDKALVCDRRVVYAGSVNLTAKSTPNEELCFRLFDQLAIDVLCFIKVRQQSQR